VILRCLAAYGLLPNAVLLLAAGYFHVGHPYINIDYLVLCACLPARRRWVPVAGFAILFLLDVSTMVAPIFNYPVADILPSIPDVMQLVTWRTLPWVAAGAVGIVGFGTLVVLAAGPRDGRVWRAGVAAAAVIVAGADVVNGSGPVAMGRLITPVNVAGSPIFRLARAVVVGSHVVPGEQLLRPAASATAALFEAARGGARADRLANTNVALVIVESLGLFQRADANRLVLDPLLTEAVQRRYDVTVGDLPFKGGTTSAEFRELCGVVSDFVTALAHDVPGCLPEILRRQGFRTTAVHGNRGNFFHRNVWWPRLGFQQMLFAEQLGPIIGSRRCALLFDGICDEDAISVVHGLLRERADSGRQFVYWLTLDSHFPVEHFATPHRVFPCNADPVTARYPDLCAEVGIWRSVMEDVAAMAADPSVPPTWFVIVGDHTPPFLSGSIRQLFVAGRVPYAELLPKQAVVRRVPRSRRLRQAPGGGLNGLGSAH